MNHLELLEKLDACADAVELAKKFDSLESAWNACSCSHWMIGLLKRIRFNDQRILRLYACACVRRTPLADGRTVWDLLADDRSRNAVIVAENYANGLATDEQLGAAGDGWWAAGAAGAAAAAWYANRAARAAALADVDAAAAGAARNSLAAAWATAWSAGVAQTAAWADVAVGDAQCNILRELVSFSIVQEHVDKLCANFE